MPDRARCESRIPPDRVTPTPPSLRSDAHSPARLLTAYFKDSRDVGDEAVLLDVDDGAGIDRQVALTGMKSETPRSLVVRVEAQAAEMQVGGAPFFIVDHQRAISGAQSAEQWVSLIRERQNA